MNKENASKLWKMIQEAGDYLLGQSDSMIEPSRVEPSNIYFHCT